MSWHEVRKATISLGGLEKITLETKFRKPFHDVIDEIKMFLKEFREACFLQSKSGDIFKA